MDVKSKEVRCKRCNAPVPGYEHRTRFTFEDGERLKLGNYAVLDCGCEILAYDVRVEHFLEGHPAELYDTVRKDIVLEFDDCGPHNLNWHYDLYGDEEGECND